MVMEYDVFDEYMMSDLVMKVNNAIKEGWRPQGGVCAHHCDEREFWAQAMVREVK